MSLITRPARAEDARFLAEIMHESVIPVVNRGPFDAALEGLDIDPVSFDEALILSGANHWGQLDSFIVLEEDGEPVGAAAAYPSKQPDMRPITPEGLQKVTEYLGWTPEQSRGFWRKYVSFFGLFPELPHLAQPADYVLEYVAIRESHRGRGLFLKLVEAHAERARALGHKTLGISAVIGNDPAYRNYEKFAKFHCRVGPEVYRNTFPGFDRFIMEL